MRQIKVICINWAQMVGLESSCGERQPSQQVVRYQ